MTACRKCCDARPKLLQLLYLIFGGGVIVLSLLSIRRLMPYDALPAPVLKHNSSVLGRLGNQQPSTLRFSKQSLNFTTTTQPSILPFSKQPSTLTTSKQPSTTVEVSKQLPTLTFLKQPSTLATSKQPPTITASKLPSTLEVSKQLPTLTSLKQPVTSSTSKQPSTVDISKQPSTVEVSKQLSADLDSRAATITTYRATYKSLSDRSTGAEDGEVTIAENGAGELDLKVIRDVKVTGLRSESTPPLLVGAGSTQRRGYVLISNFPRFSQQAVGLRSLLSPQCMIGSFGLPMYIVEPFIQKSIVHTHVPSQRNTTLLSLSDFYDLEHFNAESKKQGLAELATWDDFIDNAPRNVIIVTLGSQPRHCTCLLSNRDGTKKAPRVMWKSTKMQRCHPSVKPSVMKTLATAFDFCAVRIVAIYPDPYICSPKQLHDVILGPWKPEEVTVIFSLWCATMYIPKLSLPNPKKCQSACSWGLKNKFLPSPKLLSHIQAYESKNSLDIGHHGAKLAVMLRTEHAIFPLTAAQRPAGARLCLARTKVVVRRLQTKLGVKQPFVTVDIGRYGSGSWSKLLQKGGVNIVNNIKSTLLGFFDHSLTFSQWEATFTNVTGGITDRGYIAALQKTIASRADCLVLLGGGNFLRLALYEYLDLHPDVSSWCLHFICVEARFAREYDKTLKQRSSNSAKGHWQLLPENKRLKLYIGSLDTVTQHELLSD